MHKVLFKNSRGNIMKFVNKLSVISLIVLMFSFMNVATAANCSGTAVSSCSKITDQASCSSYFLKTTDFTGTQCKWNGSYCSNSGAQCTIGKK